MNIVVYRSERSELKRVFDYLFTQLSDVYLYNARGRHNKTVIDIGDIRIDFRCGDIYKMGGLRPDYYNTDSQPASDFLCQGAVKVDGKELADISDIRRIIATHKRGGGNVMPKNIKSYEHYRFGAIGSYSSSSRVTGKQPRVSHLREPLSW